MPAERSLTLLLHVPVFGWGLWGRREAGLPTQSIGWQELIATLPHGRESCPGTPIPIATRHRDWVAGSHIVVQDRPNLDAFNRWGSPYPAGGIFALADGSVRTISFDGEASLGGDGDTVDALVLKAFLTPNGGEVVQY